MRGFSGIQAQRLTQPMLRALPVALPHRDRHQLVPVRYFGREPQQRAGMLLGLRVAPEVRMAQPSEIVRIHRHSGSLASTSAVLASASA